MNNPINEGIKRLRALHKLTQTELATLAGIPRATVANMESLQSNPSILSVMKVANALGVSVDDLISQHQPVHVNRIKRQNMPVASQSSGDYISTKVGPMDLKSLHISEVVMAPGCHTKGVPHQKGSKELFLCLEGEATVEVQGEKTVVPKGDLIHFHGHLPHFYANEGNEPVLAIAMVTFAK